MIKYNPDQFKLFLKYSDEKSKLVQAVEGIVTGRPGSVLEIGSGPIPHFSRLLAPHSSRYVLLEPGKIEESLHDTVILKRKTWESFHPFLKYDTILASHVIAYFYDKKKQIDRMYGTLRNDGRLIIVENGLDSDFGDVLNMVALMEGYWGVDFNLPHVLEALEGKEYEEHTVNATLKVPDAETLLNILFSQERVDRMKDERKILELLEQYVNGTSFNLENKLFIVKKR